MKTTLSHKTHGETVILKVWDTGTIPGLVFAMLVSVVLSILLEYIHVAAKKASGQVNSVSRTRKYGTFPEFEDREDNDKLPTISQKRRSGFCSEVLKCQIIVTVYHVLRVAIGYCLMLFVMTYNIWIYTAVVIGSGIGYFLVHSFSDTANHESEVPNSLLPQNDEDIDVKSQEEENLQSTQT